MKMRIAIVGEKRDTPISIKQLCKPKQLLENKFLLTYDEIIFDAKYWLVLCEGFDELKLEMDMRHKVDNGRNKADSQSQNGEERGWRWHCSKCNCGRGGSEE